MMLTRCPYCSAIFRVTAEQLQVRQGQVRCGQCRRVFDGVVGLVEGQPPPPAAPLPITLASVVPPPITRPPVAPPPP
ncbi:MAG: zinc-ribbon domain-containing protein, partial [Zoogloeaceae bacterium]|nr:zinc-ribbon domain-containing protein [Zoogloeaceae bacterium]